MTKYEELKNKVLEELKNEENEIIFLKKDGSVRELKGTRNVEALPSEKRPTNNNVPNNATMIPVYDLDKDDWRGFNLLNLISINGKSYISLVEFAKEEKDNNENDQ